MPLTFEPCGYCKGTTQAEHLEERTPAGWVPSYMLAPALWDQAVAAMPAELRITTVDCPRCHGAGEEAIEHFTCKIY